MVKKLLTSFLCLFLFISASFAAKQEPKNVIFFIADGTGPTIMHLLMQYSKLAPKSPFEDRETTLEKLLQQGKLSLVYNNTAFSIVTDSAAAATQMATGHKTKPEAVGIDKDSNPVLSVLIDAKNQGKATGLITDTYVLDATPVGFFGHTENRKDYTPLSQNLLEVKPDIIMGGGFNHFVTQKNMESGILDNILKKVPYADEISPKNTDDKTFEKLLKSKYALVFDEKSLLKTKANKICGLFAAEGYPFNIDGLKTAPSLPVMTKKAVEVLSKNKQGFFLMVEAGEVDWAAHTNDAATTLREMLEAEETLTYLKTWVDQHPNTLLIVTADHDTGGFGFTYRKLTKEEKENKMDKDYVQGKYDYINPENLDKLLEQKASFYILGKQFKALPKEKQTAQKALQIINENLALDLTLAQIGLEENQTDFSIEKALKKASKTLGIVWNTKTHTSSPLIAIFYGADIKTPNYMHNTQIAQIIRNYLNEEQ